MADPMTPAKIKFQLLSELHMERPTPDYTFRIPKRADYLILAGDIGNVCTASHIPLLQAWLVEECRRFTKVFYIGGNNEFKSRSPAKYQIGYGIDHMRKLASHRQLKDKLVFLERETVDLVVEGKTISIFGGTMWSRIRDDSHGAFLDHEIEYNDPGWHNTRHKQFMEKLRHFVGDVRERDAERQILVITHHAPTVLRSARPRTEQTTDSGAIWSSYQTDILGGEGVKGLQKGDVWCWAYALFV